MEGEEGTEAGIVRLVLDVLKPREISLEDLALAVGEVEGVDAVDITVTEVDSRTETLKISINGEDISLDDIENVLNEYSTIIRSIDAISVRRIREKVEK
ncbi:MAG: hypothetical protein DRJ55_01160 [Thermoprotei archaeon]|nr:MAG: hypothetical protein DRJ46_04200 [Thermoprotei archaeon]RLE95797.1 MAG: hypothetical protein DRJ55_01160 [Thermoprotei archaeon]